MTPDSPQERWTCGSCLTSFRIGKPLAQVREEDRCGQCRRPMWHGTHNADGKIVVVVGMRQVPS